MTWKAKLRRLHVAYRYSSETLCRCLRTTSKCLNGIFNGGFNRFSGTILLKSLHGGRSHIDHRCFEILHAHRTPCSFQEQFISLVFPFVTQPTYFRPCKWIASLFLFISSTLTWQKASSTKMSKYIAISDLGTSLFATYVCTITPDLDSTWLCIVIAWLIIVTYMHVGLSENALGSTVSRPWTGFGVHIHISCNDQCVQVLHVKDTVCSFPSMAEWEPDHQHWSAIQQSTVRPYACQPQKHCLLYFQHSHHFVKVRVWAI